MHLSRLILWYLVNSVELLKIVRLPSKWYFFKYFILFLILGHRHNTLSFLKCHLNLFLNILLILFFDRRKGKDKERERNFIWLPSVCAAKWRTDTATWACALTWNWTSDILVHGTMLNRLNHTGWGLKIKFLGLFYIISGKRYIEKRDIEGKSVHLERR